MGTSNKYLKILVVCSDKKVVLVGGGGRTLGKSHLVASLLAEFGCSVIIDNKEEVEKHI